MKTEKEQIKVMTKDEIKKALETCTDIYAPCNGCPYETCTNCDATLHTDAIKLITEQEKEIERLKSEFKQLETNAEILASGIRDLNHENYELTEQVKQAQIDILNKLKSKARQDYQVGMYVVSTQEIDELIAEVKDEHSNN